MRSAGPEKPRASRERRTAKPVIDPDTGELTLTLTGVVRGDEASTDRTVIRLDLRALSADQPPTHRADDQSYRELLADAERHPESKRGRRALAEFHGRALRSLAAFLFAMLGAPLGLVLKTRNRALVFTIGFLIALLLYYAPLMASQSLASSGAAGGGLVVWLSALPLLVAISLVFARARRN